MSIASSSSPEDIIKTTISNLNNEDASIRLAAVIKIGDLARTGEYFFL